MQLNPIREATDLLGEDFGRIMGAYLEHGFVWSEPSGLALFRPCSRKDLSAWVSRDDADAWWVELAIGRGSLDRLIAHLPYSLPFIGWRREFKGDPRARFHRTQRVINFLING